MLILISSIPAFLSGIAEDITKKINYSLRLLPLFYQLYLAIEMLDIRIINTDIIYINTLLNFSFFSILFTILSISLMTQAINIIDGLNGLSLGTTIIVSLSLAYFALS